MNISRLIHLSYWKSAWLMFIVILVGSVLGGLLMIFPTFIMLITFLFFEVRMKQTANQYAFELTLPLTRKQYIRSKFLTTAWIAFISLFLVVGTIAVIHIWQSTKMNPQDWPTVLFENDALFSLMKMFILFSASALLILGVLQLLLFTLSFSKAILVAVLLYIGLGFITFYGMQYVEKDMEVNPTPVEQLEEGDVIFSVTLEPFYLQVDLPNFVLFVLVVTSLIVYYVCYRLTLNRFQKLRIGT